MLKAVSAGPAPHRQRATGLRPCRRSDLPAVAALYELVMRSGKRDAPPRLADYFERTFFDHPWADEAIPSLVYEEAGGRIVGFLGSHARRLRFAGRTLRVSCGGQLVVDPEARAKAVGAMLFRAHQFGAQDATFTDGANEIARGMWQLCGGETAHLKTMLWTRPLRPVRYAAGELLGRPGKGKASAAQRLAPLWRPLDAAALGLAGRRLRPAGPRTGTEPLTARAVLEHLPLVTRGLQCHPDYDAAFLEWLFEEMARVKSRGELVRELVRGEAGEVIGWFVYYLHPDLSQVLQVAAARGAAGEVLDSLLYHAWRRGSAAVRGRVEPQLAAALPGRKCLYRWSGAALLQARAPAVLAALLSSRCWLSRMDGESWMGHHTEAFT